MIEDFLIGMFVYPVVTVHHLKINPGIDIKEVLDTPNKDDDIIAVCDKLVTSLLTAENNVLKMICSLKRMKKQFS